MYILDFNNYFEAQTCPGKRQELVSLVSDLPSSSKQARPAMTPSVDQSGDEVRSPGSVTS